MLNRVKHKKSFITSGPGHQPQDKSPQPTLATMYHLFTRLLGSSVGLDILSIVIFS